MKTCSRCKQAKSLDDFYVCRSHKDGRQYACKACQKTVTKQNARTGRLTGNRYAAKFGITVERYWQLVNAGCGICGTKVGGAGRRIHIDHDHACCPGQTSCGACVRGALCLACNVAIGLMDDSAEKLAAAIEYLKGAQWTA